MAEIKCPSCGAGISSSGKFYTFCGTKLPDDVERKQIEIKNIAEIERARLERDKFELEKARERKKRNARRIRIIIVLFILAALVTGFFLISGLNRILYVEVVLLLGMFVFSIWSIYMKHRR